MAAVAGLYERVRVIDISRGVLLCDPGSNRPKTGKEMVKKQ